MWSPQQKETKQTVESGQATAGGLAGRRRMEEQLKKVHDTGRTKWDKRGTRR